MLHIALIVLCLAIGLLGVAASGVFCAYSAYAASYSPFIEPIILHRIPSNRLVLLVRSLRNASARYICDWFTRSQCPPTDRLIFLGSLFMYGLMLAIGLTPLTGWDNAWRFLLVPALLPVTILLYALSEAFHTLRLILADRPTALLRILVRSHKTACIDPARYDSVVQALRQSIPDLKASHDVILEQIAQSRHDVGCSRLPAPSQVASELLESLDAPVC